MAEAKWDNKEFNERKPFGAGATVVAGDNIQHSRNRWEAIKAMRSGRATPEQAALVHETDELFKDAMSQRS